MYDRLLRLDRCGRNLVGAFGSWRSCKQLCERTRFSNAAVARGTFLDRLIELHVLLAYGTVLQRRIEHGPSLPKKIDQRLLALERALLRAQLRLLLGAFACRAGQMIKLL